MSFGIVTDHIASTKSVERSYGVKEELIQIHVKSQPCELWVTTGQKRVELCASCPRLCKFTSGD